MGKLALVDAKMLERLREDRMMVGVDAHRLEINNGLMSNHCPDCDEQEDQFTWLSELSKITLQRSRVHQIGDHGGAIILSARCPLHEERVAMRRRIVIAAALKQIDFIANGVHFPCGLAGILGLSPVEVLDCLAEAKDEIKNLHKDEALVQFVARLLKREEEDIVLALMQLKVRDFAQVNWGESPANGFHTKIRETYFVSQELWRAKRTQYA